MKHRIRKFLIAMAGCVLLNVAFLSISGCRLGTNVPHDPIIYSNNVARPLHTGLLITFPRAPSTNAVVLLEFATAERRSDTMFVIHNYDRRNAHHTAAWEAASRERATGIGSSP